MPIKQSISVNEAITHAQNMINKTSGVKDLSKKIFFYSFYLKIKKNFKSSSFNVVYHEIPIQSW